jgi:hypothetical protein
MNHVRRREKDMPSPTADSPLLTRGPAFLGHALTVVTLALGGLSSFHALKADVVELRAMIAGLVQTENHLREDLRELRSEVRELKQHIAKGSP